MSSLTGLTLVLNKSWLPVGVATVKDAISLMCKESAHAINTETYQLFSFDSWAELVAEEGQEHITTVNLQIPVPEVIVLSEYDGCPGSKVVFSRRNLYKRDKHTCQYCGSQPGLEDLSIDHILPKAQGGKSTWENCVIACTDCNFKKADRTPKQAGMSLRHKPAKPAWSPFISISVGSRRLSWEKFVSEAYWNTPLDR